VHSDGNWIAATAVPERIPAAHFAKSLPVDTLCRIVVTGHEDHPVLENPGDYGFAGTLKKPFRREALVNPLGRVLGRREP